ncbi:multiple monosaccharide ABC transporter permease [Kallotenue papyrolyticum]|uniref:multiple monosaccharide ABC transporter permease n=1 Tax=Kallotenue papyrolyticum TaxID=1325125 RepID=UPI0004711C11|nr:multiple monosaccharide ABC transporter permease [Kallotenue papyrolyticum]
MSTYQSDVKRQATFSPKTIASFVRDHLRQEGMLIALIAITLFFQIATNGTLLQPLNITNLILQNSYIVVMALGMLLVIVAGHIDLSVGSVAAFIGAVAAVLMVQYNVHPVVAVLLCLLSGAAIGAIQGFWIAYMKIPAFIVTLAGMLVFRGLTLVLLKGQSIGPFPVAFQRLSSGFIPDVFGAGGLHMTTMAIGVLLSVALVYTGVRDRRNQVRFSSDVTPFPLFVLKNVAIVAAILWLCYLLASYKGLPNVLIALGVLVAFYGFVTKRTVIGRRIYALGGNEKAARLSGVNTARLTFYTFVNMGVLAALGGLIFAARLNAATPKAGNGFELDVIAANFIGGASATGGIGTVLGAVIGAFVMGVMNNGMSIVGIGIDWQQAIKGLVLLLAVFFDVYNKNKAGA